MSRGSGAGRCRCWPCGAAPGCGAGCADARAWVTTITAPTINTVFFIESPQARFRSSGVSFCVRPFFVGVLRYSFLVLRSTRFVRARLDVERAVFAALPEHVASLTLLAERRVL